MFKNGNTNKAILIGINYTASAKDTQLNGCVNDALNMYSILEKHYGFKDDNITLLLDGDFSVPDIKPEVIKNALLPTKKNILSSLRKLMRDSKGCDSIWIHYSGHGGSIEDRNGDELDGMDEFLFPCDYEKSPGNIILDDQLYNIVNNAKCKVFITMDCCHSGTVCDLTYSFSLQNNRITRRQERKKKMQNNQVYMLSGCRDDQTSADAGFMINGKERFEGAFTRGILECLQIRNYRISLFQLLVDLHSFFKTVGFDQRTVLSSSNPNPYIYLQKN